MLGRTSMQSLFSARCPVCSATALGAAAMAGARAAGGRIPGCLQTHRQRYVICQVSALRQGGALYPSSAAHIISHEQIAQGRGRQLVFAGAMLGPVDKLPSTAAGPAAIGCVVKDREAASGHCALALGNALLRPLLTVAAMLKAAPGGCLAKSARMPAPSDACTSLTVIQLQICGYAQF